MKSWPVKWVTNHKLDHNKLVSIHKWLCHRFICRQNAILLLYYQFTIHFVVLIIPLLKHSELIRKHDWLGAERIWLSWPICLDFNAKPGFLVVKKCPFRCIKEMKYWYREIKAKLSVCSRRDQNLLDKFGKFWRKAGIDAEYLNFLDYYLSAFVCSAEYGSLYPVPFAFLVILCMSASSQRFCVWS